MHSRDAVIFIVADISGKRSAVVEGEAEVLRLFKREPVANFILFFAKSQALVRRVGVDEVNGKILALASDPAVRLRRPLRELWMEQKRRII